MPKNYCIYDGYVSRTEFVTCEQIGHTDQFQDEVYEAARKLCIEKGYKTILDIGCGSAFKLIKYFRDKKFVGLDLEPNLSHIKDKYPLYDFRMSDFQKPPAPLMKSVPVVAPAANAPSQLDLPIFGLPSSNTLLFSKIKASPQYWSMPS